MKKLFLVLIGLAVLTCISCKSDEDDTSLEDPFGIAYTNTSSYSNINHEYLRVSGTTGIIGTWEDRYERPSSTGYGWTVVFNKNGKFNSSCVSPTKTVKGSGTFSLKKENDKFYITIKTNTSSGTKTVTSEYKVSNIYFSDGYLDYGL